MTSIPNDASMNATNKVYFTYHMVQHTHEVFDGIRHIMHYQMVNLFYHALEVQMGSKVHFIVHTVDIVTLSMRKLTVKGVH